MDGGGEEVERVEGEEEEEEEKRTEKGHIEL